MLTPNVFGLLTTKRSENAKTAEVDDFNNGSQWWPKATGSGRPSGGCFWFNVGPLQELMKFHYTQCQHTDIGWKTFCNFLKCNLFKHMLHTHTHTAAKPHTKPPTQPTNHPPLKCKQKGNRQNIYMP